MLFLMSSCVKKDAAYVSKCISDIGEVTLESAERIQKALAAYEALSDEEKKKVEGYLTLYTSAQKLHSLTIRDEAEKLQAQGEIDEAIALIEDNKLADSPVLKDFYLSLLESKKSISRAKKEKIELPNGEAYKGVTYKELAKMYCYNENLVFTKNATSDEEHWDNVKYVMITGDWDYKLTDPLDDVSYEWMSQPEGYDVPICGAGLECRIDCSILGYLGNAASELVFYCDNNQYHIGTKGVDISNYYSPKELQKQLVEVYLLAKEKHDELRSKGIITNESTQYDIAKAYADWFCSLGIVQKDGEGIRGTLESIVIEASSGTAYAALFAKASSCLGRAAAFQAFMRMEGITCYGLVCGHGIESDRRWEHIVPWMILDGKEYSFESNMDISLMSVDKSTATSKANNGEKYNYQLYFYARVLERAGLEYDKSMDWKYYIDYETGKSYSKEEWMMR